MLEPDEIETEPPSKYDWEEPLDRYRFPTPLSLLPTITLTDPAWPPTADPLDTKTVPEFPLTASPDRKLTRPDAPSMLASAEVTVTSPEPSEGLDPLNR
jgi:hypothetical protein